MATLKLFLAFVLLAFGVPSTTAFRSFGGGKSKSAASAKPKFDAGKGKWVKAPSDDGQYPYDAVGSLLRQGPSPFFQRVSNPAEYEQMVLQYMAEAGVSRAEATGNMDAKLNNVLDWSYQKKEERNGAPKVDYTLLKTKDAILTTVWGLGITALVVVEVSKQL